MNPENHPLDPLKDFQHHLVDELIHRLGTVVYQDLWCANRKNLPHYKAYQSIWSDIENPSLELQGLLGNQLMLDKERHFQNSKHL